MSTGNQKLPQKEAGTFKKIVRCYECKQYKNGLKFARQILSNSKFSEHGETMAMKGLILNCMGRKEEAYENVRRGLKNDIKSHVCWHVYGLLQRSDKKYEEAIKCYRNALKWDKENVQILRDLSLLQVQMRDIEGYRDTRYQLLKARPAQRSSWVGYAVSYHLLKDYAMAIKVMAEYRKTQTIPQTRPDVEYSEMILYEVQLMLEAGRTEEAMKHLREYETYIADTLMALETRAEIYLASGKLLDAEDGYRDLINRNPENYGYYSQLEKCLKFDSVEEKVKHYRELQEKYPRSSVARRVPLTITTGEKFAYHLSWYLRRALHKGVPSLFMSIRGLYSDPEKMKVIGDMVTGYVESLRTHGYFLPEDTGVKEPPSAFLWALFLLAQHHDRLGNSVRAVELIDEAIEHTPTDVQLYMLRARIYKHAGDYHKAAKWMEEARTLDTADRFINCKCVKYLLRINQINQAIETAGLFTREGLPPLQTMDEMQCMWFQTELALAYQRLGKPGHALQKLHEIEQHFTDIVDDQFDFHTYCMRRMTLRAYIGVVHLEDTLRHHPFYFVVAKTTVEIYIFLHDNPSAKLAELNGPAEYENKLSAAEMKKVKRKERKAQLKAQAKAHEEKKENKPHNRTEEEKKTEEKGEDKFSPKELVSVERPLEEALKFLTPLQLLSRERIEPHLLAYAVHSRRRKLLLSLQAIKRARVVDPENGGLHAAIVDFALAVQSCRDKLPDPMRVVIDEILPSLTGGLDLSELNRQFIERHQDSLQHLIHGAEVLYRLHPDAQDRAVSLITSLPDTLKDRTLKLCVQVQQLLKNGTLGDCSEVLKSYEDKCHALFPLATAFMPPLVLVPSSKELGDDSNGQSEPPLKNPQVPLEDECSGGQD